MGRKVLCAPSAHLYSEEGIASSLDGCSESNSGVSDTA